MDVAIVVAVDGLDKIPLVVDLDDVTAAVVAVTGSDEILLVVDIDGVTTAVVAAASVPRNENNRS